MCLNILTEDVLQLAEFRDVVATSELVRMRACEAHLSCVFRVEENISK